MKKGAAAKRYAKALIEIGQEEKRYEDMGSELRSIASIFAATPELKRFVLNPMYKLDDRQGIVEKAADALKISLIVKKFLALLVETRAIGIIEDISSAYSRMEDEFSGRIKVSVKSAIKLDEGRLKEIQKRLQDITGKKVILSVEKQPALIGGLVFRIGNTILDGSIKTQLQKMRERIIEGSRQ